MNPNEKMIALAAEKLDLSKSDAACSSVEVPGMDNACFFSAGSRGSGRLLVTDDLESLWASSSISPTRQVEAFLQGRRN